MIIRVLIHFNVCFDRYFLFEYFSPHYYFFLFYRSPFYFLICQVAIEVEREEDEGGMAGETFTDYVSILFLDHS